MKYRPHRGSLQDAMAECREFDGTLTTLAEHLGINDLGRISVKFYGFDYRVDWNTYLVCIDGHAEGFTDGQVT